MYGRYRHIYTQETNEKEYEKKKTNKKQKTWLECKGLMGCDNYSCLWLLSIVIDLHWSISFATYRTNATPLGRPVSLSRNIFFCTMEPYLPKIVSSWSSVIVRGRLVTYKFVSLIDSPPGRAYETCEVQEKDRKLYVTVGWNHSEDQLRWL